MNIRDVAGFDSTQELYETASHYGVHVGAVDRLIRFAVEIQRRALAEKARRDLVLDKMVENAESLDLYLTKEASDV